jgi:hypothetical protein
MNLIDFHNLITNFIEREPDYSKSEIEVIIPLSSPSIGPCSSTHIKDITKGIDWNSGKILIHTEDRIVKKTKEEDIFDAARDLLMYLATKPMKRSSYEVEQSQKILKRIGYVDQEFEKYRKFFHKEKT